MSQQPNPILIGVLNHLIMMPSDETTWPANTLSTLWKMIELAKLSVAERLATDERHKELAGEVQQMNLATVEQATAAGARLGEVAYAAGSSSGLMQLGIAVHSMFRIEKEVGGAPEWLHDRLRKKVSVQADICAVVMNIADAIYFSDGSTRAREVILSELGFVST